MMRESEPEAEGRTVPPSIADGIAAIEEAIAESKNSWPRLMRMGEGLEYLSQQAIRKTGTNKRMGGPYAKAFSACLQKYPQYQKGPVADKSTRAALLNIMENRAAIEQWRANELSEDQRIDWCHPVIVWKHWRAATKQPTRKRANGRDEELQKLKEENAKLRKENEDLKRTPHYRADGIDRSKLAIILGQLGSEHEGVVSSAAQTAEKMRQKAGLTWQDVLGV
jgi:hypothetical protein